MNRPNQQPQLSQLVNQLNNMSLSSSSMSNMPPGGQQQQQQQQLQQQQQQQYQSQNQNINMNRNQPHSIDLLREKRLIHPYTDESDEPLRPIFPHEFYTNVNCHHE